MINWKIDNALNAVTRVTFRV